LAVTGGFAEVLRESVNILATTCERSGEIDVQRAQKSLERAESELKLDKPMDDYRRAQERLKRARCRIQVHARTQH
jgi:F0F1-type ATP synthase epsilon subunit